MDVVPGSVTGWTVTAEDQRQVGRALVGLRLRNPGYWFAALVLPPMVAGAVWFAWFLQSRAPSATPSVL